MTVHGRADHRDPAGAGGRCEDGGCLPSSRHLGCHLLQVEGQVWRAGRVGGATAEGVGGRERQAEEAAGGSDAGQRTVEGCSWKKCLRPLNGGRRWRLRSEERRVGKTGVTKVSEVG